MLRSTSTALAALLLVSACQPGATDVGSDGPILDPSPQAPLGEAINEPTDGFENEIQAD